MQSYVQKNTNEIQGHVLYFMLTFIIEHGTYIF